jgi:hypothetical protein
LFSALRFTQSEMMRRVAAGSAPPGGITVVVQPAGPVAFIKSPSRLAPQLPGATRTKPALQLPVLLTVVL